MAPNMGQSYVYDLAVFAKENFCVYIHRKKVHHKKVNFYGNGGFKSLYYGASSWTSTGV
jgi:hypothetical protein